MHKLTLTAAVLSVAALAVPSASAQAPQRPASISVPVRDLDLRTPGGRATLERRLDAAVERVCARDFRLNFHMWRERSPCRRHALADAQRQVRDAVRRALGEESPDRTLAAR